MPTFFAQCQRPYSPTELFLLPYQPPTLQQPFTFPSYVATARFSFCLRHSLYPHACHCMCAPTGSGSFLEAFPPPSLFPIPSLTYLPRTSNLVHSVSQCAYPTCFIEPDVSPKRLPSTPYDFHFTFRPPLLIIRHHPEHLLATVNATNLKNIHKHLPVKSSTALPLPTSQQLQSLHQIRNIAIFMCLHTYSTTLPKLAFFFPRAGPCQSRSHMIVSPPSAPTPFGFAHCTLAPTISRCSISRCTSETHCTSSTCSSSNSSCVC